MYAIIENWDTLTEAQKQTHRDESSAYTGGVVAERLSLDGTKALLNKSDGAHTLEQIKVILKGAEWTEQGEIDFVALRKLEEAFAKDVITEFGAENKALLASGDMTNTQFNAMLADTEFNQIVSVLMMSSLPTASALLSALQPNSWIDQARIDKYKDKIDTFIAGLQ